MRETDPDRGPVLVTVEYSIDPVDAAEFIAAMREMRRIRRRDGAVRWGLFEDAAKPGRYLESFLVQSWGEHLRQHERITVSDPELARPDFRHPDISGCLLRLEKKKH